MQQSTLGQFFAVDVSKSDKKPSGQEQGDRQAKQPS